MLLHEANPPADVNVRSQSGDTALMVASERGHESIVRLLLQETTPPADVRAKNHRGGTAMMKAHMHGHVGTVEMLLAAAKDEL